MAKINAKVKSLYDALKADGSDVGTEQEFNDWFFKPGKEGYANRKRVYDAFKADGADIGKNYEEFRDWLGLHAVQQPTQPRQQASQPHTSVPAGFGQLNMSAVIPKTTYGTPKKFSAKEYFAQEQRRAAKVRAKDPAIQEMAERGNIHAQNVMEQGTENFEDLVEQSAERQQRTGENAMQQLEDDMAWNAIHGDTEAMKNIGGDVAMQQYQDTADYAGATGEMLRNPVELGMTLGYNEEVQGRPMYAPTLVRDENGDIMLGDDGKPLVGMSTDDRRRGAYRQGMVDAVEAEKRRRAAADALDLDKAKSDLANIEEAMKKASVGSEDYWMLRTARNATQDRIRDIEAVHDDADGTFLGGLWRGTRDALFDISNWNLGISDTYEAVMKERARTNEMLGEGNEASQILAKASYGADAAAAYKDENVGNGYRFGGIAGNSAPFMVDFIIGSKTGLLRGISRGGRKLGVSMARRLTANEGAGLLRNFNRAVVRNTGIALGDVVAGGALSVTVQGGKTGAYILSRYTGNAVYDPSTGKYTFEGGDSVGDAIYKGLANSVIENYTEMLGAHFAFGKWGKKYGSQLLNKVGLGKASELIGRMSSTDAYKTVRKWMKMGGWNGLPSEIMEEEAGIPLHAVFDGSEQIYNPLDPKQRKEFKRQQLDIVGGMIFSMGLTGGAIIGAYKGKQGINKAYSARQYYRAKHQLNRADQVASFRMTADVWQPIKEQIENAENKDFAKVFDEQVLQNDALSNQEKEAAWSYAQQLLRVRGFNIGQQMGAAKVAEDNGGHNDSQEDESYAEGYNTVEPTEMNNAYNRLVYFQQRLDEYFERIGKEEDEQYGYHNDNHNHIDAQSIADNPTYTDAEGDRHSFYSDDVRQLAQEVVNAQQGYEGMLQRVRDDMDDEVQQTSILYDQRTNPQTGMIQQATLKAQNPDGTDRKVYVTSGNIVMMDDGQTVDRQKSDMSVVIVDDEGKVEMISPEQIFSLDTPINGEEAKQQAIAAIQAQRQQEAQDKIDGKVQLTPNATYPIVDDSGQQSTITLVPNAETGLVQNEDGTINVSIDGQQATMSLDDLQRWVDNANMLRTTQAQADRQAEEAAQQEQPEPREYAAGDSVMVKDDSGNTVEAQITDVSPDGIVIRTASSVNGHTNQQVSKEQLDRMLIGTDSTGSSKSDVILPQNENIPPNRAKSDVILPQNTENGNNGGKNIPQRAIDRIPYNEVDDGKGNVRTVRQWEQAEHGDTYDALLEIYGDEERTKKKIGNRIKHIEKQIKTVDKQIKKLDDSDDFDADIDNAESYKQLQAQKEQLEGQKSYWQSVQNIPGARTRAQVEAQRAEADRRAKEERERYLAEQQRQEEERQRQAEEERLRQEEENQNNNINFGFGNADEEISSEATPAEQRRHELAKAKNVKDLQKAAKKVYGKEAVSDLEPRTTDELVATWLNPHSLNFEGKTVGGVQQRGVSQELGITSRGIGKYKDTGAINYWLAPKGEGMSVDQAAHEIWQNRPSSMESVDTSEIKDSLINLLQTSARPSDISSLILRNRIAQAEELLALEEEQEQTVMEHAAWERQQNVKTYCDMLAATVDDWVVTPEMEAYINSIIIDETYEDMVRQQAEEDKELLEQQNNDYEPRENEGADAGSQRMGEESQPGAAQSRAAEGEGIVSGEETGQPVGGEENTQRTSSGATNATAATQRTGDDVHDRGVSVQEGTSGRIRLTAEQSDKLLSQMTDLSEAAVEIALTPSNWVKEFGESGIVETPIGQVKMGDSQYIKFTQEDRNGKLGMAKPTLENPDVIIEDSRPSKDGKSERPYSYIFIKTFKAADGHRYYYFTSITVSKEGREVVISNQERNRNRISKLLKNDEIAWINSKFSLHPMPQNGKSVSLNDSNKPTSTDSQPALLGINSPDFSAKIENNSNTSDNNSEILSSPIGATSTSEHVETQRQSVNTEPTDAQKEAGNYKKGHIKVDGYDITIENPKGSTRSGKDASGKAWSVPMHYDYGYILGTEGVDGDHIDVYLSDNPTSGNVYVVDQINQQDGSFDEHKVMYGFPSMEAAIDAYKSQYEDGWKVGTVTEVSREDFKKWVESSHRKTKPFAEYKANEEKPKQTAAKPKKEAEAKPQRTKPKHKQQKQEPKKNEGQFGLVSDERMEELKKRLRAKLNNLNMGVDPEVLAIGLELTAGYIDRGVKKFADYGKAMIADLGDVVRPYLKAFYNGVRDMPEITSNGLDSEMDDYDTVSKFNVATIGKEGEEAKPSLIETAEQISNEQTVQKQADPLVQAAQETGHLIIGSVPKTEDEKKTDNQGNPINSDGKLIKEAVASVDDITDEDFINPSRTVELPKLPSNVDSAIGANGKPVIIKKNIFEKNGKSHPDVTPKRSRGILKSALYNPTLYGQNQKAKRPYNWVLIKVDDEKNENKLVLLEVNHSKDNVEIINWHYVRNQSLETIKRQAEREGGPVLILPSSLEEEAGGLSGRTQGSSSEGKGNKKTDTKQSNNKKKVVTSQSKGQPSLFDDLFVTDNNNLKPQDNDLRGTDELRTEGLQTDGNNEGEHSARRSETSGQESRGTDRSGEESRDRGLQQGDGRPAGRLQGLNQHNNHAERGKDYAPKNVDDRIAANIAAIELAQQITEEGRQATPAEMTTLRKYSGWGGLGKAFKEKEQSWEPDGTAERLKALLGDEAYQEAVMSRNSAYFTPAPIIDSMWDIAKALGFKGGNILEGSAGIGNIIGLMPRDISDRSNIHAVEIDRTTGMILSLLYPDAQTDIQGFEKTKIRNGSVDLAITNVPFVTGLHVNDTTGDSDLSRKFGDIHDFCIAKNIRKLKPGGIGIFITSSGTMDKSQKLRDWITSEGDTDVIGAFRMNNQTFGGTSATSDIIVVRRRVNGVKSPMSIDVSHIGVERMGEYVDFADKKNKRLPVGYNQYFIDHPENMGGKMYLAGEQGDTYRPASLSLFPMPNISQQRRMSDWVKRMKEEAASLTPPLPDGEGSQQTQPLQEDESTEEQKVYEALGDDVREGSMLVDKNGNLCIASYGEAVPLAVNKNKVKGHTKVECFNDYSRIKNAVRKLLDYETQNEGNEGLQPLLDELNRAYDSFVNRYGNLNKNTSISFLKNDMDFASIAALEDFKESNDKQNKRIVTYSKSDVFKKRVVEKEKEPKPKDVRDGVITSIYQYGKIDLQRIAEQLGKTEDEVKKEIISNGLGFENPLNGETQVSYEYLSGNVREKLRQAEQANEDGRYDSNIKALKKVIPMNIPSHLIEFTLGSSWLDPDIYEEYIKDRTGVEVKARNIDGTWAVESPTYGINIEKNRSFGVHSSLFNRDIYGHELIIAALKNKTIAVTRTVKLPGGKSETETDKDATTMCAQRIEEIREDFKEWARGKLQQDAELSKKYEERYNDQFNNYVPREIPNNFLPEHFSGSNHKITLRAHQAKAAIRATMQNVLFAHEVGSGKTFTLITTAMEMRRLGTAKKPMVVVQNATVGQFVASAKELYPNAKILTIGDNEHNEAGRKAFYAKIKYNDWDMIVIPQSVVEKIPDSDERQLKFIQDRVAEKQAVIAQMSEAGVDDPFVTRRAEKELQTLQAEMTNISAQIADKKKKKDDKKTAVAIQNATVRAQQMLDRKVDEVEDFDDMGIDALLVDEAHEYKHLGFSTAMQRGVKGVDPSYSKKSQGIYLKCQSVMEKSGGKNVVFATGTPISNTAAEIWTFMKYLMPADTMREYGIYYFDDFVRNFGTLSQMPEFDTSGKFKEANRFRGYSNLPELVRIWSGVADTVLSSEVGDLKAKIPEMKTGKAIDIYLPQSRALRSVMKYVREQLKKFSEMTGKEKRQNSHIPLVMYGIAKAAAVDPRLVVDNAEDDPRSKTNATVKEVLTSLDESKSYKGTVAIFADNYQNNHTGFNLFDDIKKKLVKAGVPENEIVIIRPSMKVTKKTEIFDKLNAGEVRVVLGTTFTLGTGANFQERLYEVIHMDAPNRPMDYTQRNGRILRQGNLHKEWGIPVKVVRFGVEDSLDVTAYQRLKTKGAIADSIMHGKKLMQNSMEDRTIEEEEDEFGDTVAQLSGSEYALLKQAAEREVRKWENKKKQWEADQVYIHTQKPRLEGQIKAADKRKDEAEKALETLATAGQRHTKPSITIGKKSFANVEGMGDFIKDFNKGVKATEEKLRKSYSSDKAHHKLDVTISGLTFHIDLALGKETESRQGSLFDVVKRHMTYSCPELSLEEVPVSGGLLRNALEDITQNVLTGDDFRDRKERAEAEAERLQKELEQVIAREGKPFQYGEQLEKAQSKLEDYTEKMKKELEEKEKKYAEIDAEVDEAQDVSDAKEDDTLEREGDGEYSDEELSLMNDPVAKWLGKSQRTKAQQKAFADRERKNMETAVRDMAARLHLDNVEIVTEPLTVTDRRGREHHPKGFYNKANGKITIVIPSHANVEDALQTLLHEGVAHYGLRKLFGSHFDTFLDNVYAAADNDVRRRITELALRKYGGDFHVATEEYLASLAEQTDFENMPRGFWQKVKDFFLDMLHAIGFEGFADSGVTLSDNELRYILWRSYENLKEPGRYRSILGEAEDVAKQAELKVGNYAEADAQRQRTEPEGERAAEGVAESEPRLSSVTNEYGKPFVLSSKGSIDMGVIDKASGLKEAPIRLSEGEDTVDAVGKHHGYGLLHIDAEHRQQILKAGYSSVVDFVEDIASNYRTIREGNIVANNQTYLLELTDKHNNTLYVELSKDGKYWNVNSAGVFRGGYSKNKKEVYTRPAVGSSSGTRTAGVNHGVNNSATVTSGNSPLTSTAKVSNNSDTSANNSEKVSEPRVWGKKDLLSKAEQVTEGIEPDLLFRDSIEDDDDTARAAYDKWADAATSQAREAWQDSMISVRNLQRAVLRQRGETMEDFEDAYEEENRSHGRGQDLADYFRDNLYKPIYKSVSALAKAAKVSVGDVTQYMMAKHGLERNEVFAKRDAQAAWERYQEKQKERFAEYQKAHPNGNKTIADFMEKGYDDFYNQYREKDYSGLTKLTGTDNVQDAEAEAKRIVADMEGRNGAAPYTTDLWQKTNAATKWTLEQAFRNGIISKDNYEQVRDMFKWYIPLRGWSDDTAEDIYDYVGSGNNGTSFSPTVKKAHGRKTVADNPIAYIASMGISSIVQGMRNKYKQSFLNFVERHPTNLVTVSEMWYRNHGTEQNPDWYEDVPKIPENATAEEVAAIVEKHEKDMEALAAQGLATKERGRLHLSVPIRNGQALEHHVEVMMNGKKYVLYINGNPRAAQALNGTRARRASEHGVTSMLDHIANSFDEWNTWLGKRLAWLTRLLSRGQRQMGANFTSRNPKFMLGNAFRDVDMALAVTAIKEPLPYMHRFRMTLLNLTLNPAHGGLARMFTLKHWYEKYRAKGGDGTTDLNGKPLKRYKKWYWEFNTGGARTGFTGLKDIEDYKKELRRDYEDAQRSPLNIRKLWHALGDALEYANSCVEDMTRFATFVASRKSGRNVRRSVTDAKNITLNFNRKGNGEMGNQAFREAMIFVNPAIQSAEVVASLATHHPVRFSLYSAMRVLIGVGTPMMTALLWSVFGGGDGDDDDDGWNAVDEYWNLPSWQRRNNFVCWIPGTRKFFMIPLAQEFRVENGFGEAIASSMSGHSDENPLVEVLTEASGLLPLDFTGNDNNPLITLAPTIIQPAVQIGFNTDFTGRPIYKDSEWNKYEPAWQKAYIGTPRELVAISEKINGLTGGNDHKQGWWERTAVGNMANNPAVVDHVLKGYFGGTYSMLAQLGGLAFRAWNGESPDITEIPMADRLVTAPREQQQNGKVKLPDWYYDMADESKRYQDEWSGYRKDWIAKKPGAKEHVDSMMKSDEFRMQMQVSAYINAINQIRAAQPTVENPQTEDEAKSKQELAEGLQHCLDMLEKIRQTGRALPEDETE